MNDFFRPTHPDPDTDTSVATLPNGVRVVTVRLPYMGSVCASVFVRTGSGHESRALNGISHFVEHMAFKGTHGRNCQQINLDAERLGAEVDAHTDKDHTAYHMRGLKQHMAPLLRMLADIVQNGTFPEAEIERERQVLLHELAENEDDPLTKAYELFDKTCFGTHPLAQPVIGTRGNIQRFTRADLVDYVQRQYGGANVVVGVAGDVDPDEVARIAEDAFGAMPRGSENTVAAPGHIGGIRSYRDNGSTQAHVVLGFPIPSSKDDPHPGVVAATLFGEGMSSPLMDQLRERRGLVYYAACSADVTDLCGQFVIEASTAPEHLDEFFVEVARLLAEHADGDAVDAVGMERARNQIAVRSLRAQEQPFRRLEEAAQDLYVHGRVRPRAELAARVEAVTAEQVQGTFRRMLSNRPAVAVAGKLGKGAGNRFFEAMAARRG